MSNRQARRDQMRATRQQRAQRPSSGGGRPSKPSGTPSRRNSNGPLGALLARPFLLVVAGVIIALGVVLGLIIAFDSTDDGGATARLEAAKESFPFDMTDGRKVGSDDAPVKLVAYEDFQCPFCLQYTANQEPTLVDEYVKTGKVQIEFRHLPILGNESLRAARAGECAAEQNRFWQFHHELFLAQAKAGQLTDEELNVGRFSDDNLRRFAQTAGMDLPTFETCLANDASLQAVQASTQEAAAFGIRSTPGFLINGIPIGSGSPATLDVWREILDAQINATPTPTASGTAEASPSPSGTAATATPTP